MAEKKEVLPARAGMIPNVVAIPMPEPGAPRTSGDDPRCILTD